MYRFLLCSLVGLLGLTAVSPASHGADLVIEKGGQPWQIFLNADAPDSVQHAAKELRTYLSRVSGVEMPITNQADPNPKNTIFLGDTAFAREKGVATAELPHDGFRILTGEDWIVIAGRDDGGPPKSGSENPYQRHETYNEKLKIGAFGDAGTLQGVYEFLRNFCGVRWYMPGPLGEVVPSLPKIVIPPTDLRDAPIFEYRYPYFCFFNSSPQDALWYRRAGFGAPYPVAINHSFQKYLKYKDSHPEYFALIDGQRDFTTLSSVCGPGNLNLSDPGLIKQFIADVNEYFDQNPGEMLYPIVPPDGMHRISEDPASQAQIDLSQGEGGKFSNYVWGFINKVAEGVREKHPDKFIAGIAYERYTFPPTNLEKLSPNIIVMLCKSRRVMPDPKLTETLRRRVDGWAKLAKSIYCWEYYCDVLFNAGWRGYPAHYPPAFIQEDLRYLKGKSKGEMIEAETWTTDQYVDPSKIALHDPGLQHLRLYVTSQLLWNPDRNLDDVLNEYYRLFYGPAEAEMKQFWKLAEDAWATRKTDDPSGVYPKETLIAMLACLDSAKKKTEDGSPYQARVKLIEKEFTPAAAKAGRLAGLITRKAEVFRVPLEKEVNAYLVGSFWTKVPVLNLLDSNYASAVPPTHVRLAWTEQGLKIAMTCFEPKIDSLKGLVTAENWKRESLIWEDDAVEVFLQLPGGDTCLQFIVNSNGAACFATKSASKPSDADLKKLESTKVAVKRAATSWTVEMNVPWKELNLARPASGTELKANFYRTRWAGGSLQEFSWSPMTKGQFFAPDDFGVLVLGDSAER